MLKQAPRRTKPAPAEPQRAADAAPRNSRPFVALGYGLIGGLLLWAAFPPVNLPWLAWVAPLPWLWLVQMPQLPGRRPYVWLWLAGSLHWLAMLQGIRLAHPALYGGWLALSLYLGVYLPLFIGLTRIAVHRLHVSLVLAAPVVWVGLELARGHLVTGFSNGLLAHTQAEIPLLIQISDLAGGYGLSFVIILVAACLTMVMAVVVGACGSRSEPQPTGAWRRFWPVAPLAAVLLATLAYGNWRLSQTPPGAASAPAKVALIQGSLDTVFGQDRTLETLEHYRELTDRAVAQRTDLDLVVWPESSLQVPERIALEPLAALPQGGLSAAELRRELEYAQAQFRNLVAGETARSKAMLVVGSTTYVYSDQPPRTYNSALVADKTGEVVCRYYKTHPVMFGEYIPFGEMFPWLYRLTPMSGGLSIGDGPRAFQVAGVSMSPNICFESTIPHLVRGQLLQLAQQGTPADVIVNVSNDGWFWGSSILDLHYRSNIFRAVENRKPLLVAANTGISAWIDGSGRPIERSQRRRAEVLFAEVTPDGRHSPYHVLGDGPAWLCAAAAVALAALGLRRPRQAILAQTPAPAAPTP